MKKKIIILSEALNGGVRRHVLDLLSNLDVNKFDIYFLYGDERMDSIMKNNLANLENRGIKLIKIKSFKKKIGVNDIRAFKEIFKLIKEISPDIVHCHSSKAGALGRIAAKLNKVNQIYYTPHAYIFQNEDMNNIKKNIYIFIEKILSRVATTKTINVSYGEQNIALKNNIDIEDKFLVIYNGISKELNLNEDKLNTIRNSLKIKKEDIIIGNISRIEHQKDPNTFIKVAEKVCKENDNIKFIYVGDGSLLEESKNIAKKCELDNKLIFVGYSEDTDYMLNIFNIFLTTSLYEGMPYSLIEASRSGLPIIATNVIGNNEVVKQNYNGYLFDIRDIKQASEYIDCLIKDKLLLNNISNNSINRFNQLFLLDNMLEKYEKLYYG